MRLTATGLPPILVQSGEHPGVQRAAADLADDLERILGRRPEIGTLAGAPPERALIIGTNCGHVLDGWQASEVRIEGDSAWFTGSDRCGTMWAVYRACELLLGVDPLWRWTDHPPQPRAVVELAPLPCQLPLVRHRGWFLNDEDLLSEWQPGSGTRDLDYPFYRQVIAPQAFDRVLEAALRLRMDTIIPASFIDVGNPPEAALVEAAVARGLFVNQHHIEPLGVSHFTLEKWAQRQGWQVPSYICEPERLRACWRHYASLWSRFGDQVIWTIGLRGRGDRPVWHLDDRIDPTPAGRGRLISAAMADQRAIIREVTGREDATVVTQLWAEMTELNANGHLDIPADTIRVLCDHGPTQVWGIDFATTRRDVGQTGIYYHAAFWGTGPHLVQGVRPARIDAMLGEAIARGDNAFALLNIANLRETCLAARQCAALWWDGQQREEATVLGDWCREQFGNPAAVDLYTSLFDAYADQGRSNVRAGQSIPDPELVRQHGYLLLDGDTRLRGLALLDLAEDLVAGRPPRKASYITTAEGLAWIAQLPGPAAERFAALARRIATHLPAITPNRRDFLRDHLLVQVWTMAGLSAWCAAVVRAVQAAHQHDHATLIRELRSAAAHLDEVLSRRSVAATGPWTDWYRGDRKMNLPLMLERTRTVLSNLAGTAA